MAQGTFRTRKQRHVAALLQSKPMSLFELLGHVGGDKKTLTRTLMSLKEQELVDFVDAGSGPPSPGNPSGLYSLTAKGAAAAATAVAVLEEDDAEATFDVGAGQTWVTATVPDEKAADLRRVAAGGDVAAAAGCVARMDGAQRRYVFVFAADVGDQAPQNLRASLEALGLDCTLEVVGVLQSSGAFADSAHVAVAAGGRAAAELEQ